MGIKDLLLLAINVAYMFVSTSRLYIYNKKGILMPVGKKSRFILEHGKSLSRHDWFYPQEKDGVNTMLRTNDLSFVIINRQVAN